MARHRESSLLGRISKLARRTVEAAGQLRFHRRACDKPVLRQIADLFFLYFAGIISPSQYYSYQLCRRESGSLIGLPYLGSRARREIGRKLNPACWHDVARNKWLFSLYINELGLPHPRVYGYFDAERGADYLGRPLRSQPELLALLESESLSEFVLKPVCGGQGRNVMVLSRSANHSLRRMNGTSMAAEDLIKAMSEGSYLVQAKVEQDSSLAQMGGTALNTYRIVTFVDRQGQAHIHHAALRLGQGVTDVDNYSQGGLYVEIDHVVGLLDRGTVNYSDELVDAHPDTGLEFQGCPAPHWEAVSALALRAASLFPLGSVGWDIAASTEGPVIIEANHDWDFRRIHRGYLQPEVRRQLAEYRIRQR